MAIPEDVVAWLQDRFAAADADDALRLLESAVDHEGAPVSQRLMRCAAVGSRGDLQRLKALVNDLRVDWRDVIVAGEYESRDGALIRLHDFNNPIAPS